MSFFFALLLYVVMAAVLATGIVMAVHGTFWLLIVGFLLFVIVLGKVCLVPH